MLWPARRHDVQALVDSNYESLYRFAFRLSGSHADAEDLVQETFCKAQMRWHQLRDKTRARSWLFRILHNEFLHRKRSEKSHPTLSLEMVEDEPSESSEALEFEIDPAQMQKALDAMPEPFRTPLILFYFEEMSYRDIAENLDLPIGTVMSRLSRAKTFLRSRLLPREPLPAPEDRKAVHDL